MSTPTTPKTFLEVLSQDSIEGWSPITENQQVGLINGKTPSYGILDRTKLQTLGNFGTQLGKDLPKFLQEAAKTPKTRANLNYENIKANLDILKTKIEHQVVEIHSSHATSKSTRFADWFFRRNTAKNTVLFLGGGQKTKTRSFQKLTQESNEAIIKGFEDATKALEVAQKPTRLSVYFNSRGKELTQNFTPPQGLARIARGFSNPNHKILCVLENRIDRMQRVLEAYPDREETVVELETALAIYNAESKTGVSSLKKVRENISKNLKSSLAPAYKAAVDKALNKSSYKKQAGELRLLHKNTDPAKCGGGEASVKQLEYLIVATELLGRKANESTSSDTQLLETLQRRNVVTPKKNVTNRLLAVFGNKEAQTRQSIAEIKAQIMGSSDEKFVLAAIAIIDKIDDCPSGKSIRKHLGNLKTKVEDLKTKPGPDTELRDMLSDDIGKLIALKKGQPVSQNEDGRAKRVQKLNEKREPKGRPWKTYALKIGAIAAFETGNVMNILGGAAAATGYVPAVLATPLIYKGIFYPLIIEPKLFTLAKEKIWG